MPKAVRVAGVTKTGAIKPRFSCCLNTAGEPMKNCAPCERCQGRTKDGQECKRTSCMDSKYCFQHLQSVYGVKIAPSKIPGAGSGLFATRDFARGAKIAPLGGRKISQETFENMYDFEDEDGEKYDPTAPYAYSSSRPGKVNDAMCERSAGSYANDPRDERVNARIGKAGILKAIKAIAKGDEIYVSYGGDYWENQDQIRVQEKPVRGNKATPKGRRGVPAPY